MKVNSIDASQFRNTTFFSMSLKRRFGNRAKVKDVAKLQQYLAEYNAKDGEAPSISQSIEGGSKATSTTKVLIRSKAFDALNEFMSQTKDSICGRFGIASPSRIREGIYVVGNGMIEEINNRLKKANTELKETHVKAFLEDYLDAKERSKTLPVKEGGLGPLFDERDYPLSGDLEAAFEFDWQFLALSVPEDLPEALKKEQQQKMEAQFTEAAEEVKDALRISFQELITHAVERLTPGDDGKPKTFRNTLLENVQAFIDVFSARNIMNDTDLQALVDKAQDVLIGINPDDLRKKNDVREETKSKFAEVKSLLDTMVENKKTRRFDFSQD